MNITKKFDDAYKKEVFPILKVLTDIKCKSLPEITIYQDGEIRFISTVDSKEFESTCIDVINLITQRLLDAYLPKNKTTFESF